MPPPTLFQQWRQIFGRALRETGQAVDRLGVKAAILAVTPHDFYDDPVLYEDHLSRHRHQSPLLTCGRPVIHPEVAFLAPCSTLIGTVAVGRGSSVWYGAVLRADEGEFAEAFQKRYALEEGIAATAAVGTTSAADVSIASAAAGDGSGITDSAPGTTAVVAKAAAAANASTLEPWPLSEQRWNDQLDHHGGGIFIGQDTNIQDGCIVTARLSHTVIGDGVTVGHMAQIHSATVHDYCLIGMGSLVSAGVVIGSESFLAAGSVVPPNTMVPSGELWAGNPARKLRDLTPEQRARLHHQSSEYVVVATRHRPVMELGGNLDANGANVYIVPEEEIQELKAGWDKMGNLLPLQLPSSSTTTTVDIEKAAREEEDIVVANANNNNATVETQNASSPIGASAAESINVTNSEKDEPATVKMPSKESFGIKVSEEHR
jgi:carbonic anhydrase/acetyltransferase-like protein (isoleucine patch superfamily)